MQGAHINAPNAPTPIAYSHAVRMGQLLFVSGQLPLDGERRLVAPGDLAGQTRRVLENLTIILKEAGASWEHVAKLTIFVVGMDRIAEVRTARQAFYDAQGVQPPASTAVQVGALALPGMQGKGRPLVFRSWAPGDAMDKAVWDIAEPKSEKPVLEPDIVLLPLLAFDAAGWRLGYGGGY